QPVAYGKVIEVDRERNTITVERMPGKVPSAPRAFIKDLDLPPIKALQTALAEVAEALSADFGLPGTNESPKHDDWGSAFADQQGTFRAARALLAAEAPRLASGIPLKRPGESSDQALKRI